MEHQQQKSLRNSLGLDSACARFFEVSDVRDVQEAINLAKDLGLRPLALGEGSNVVLPPELPMAVLRPSDQSVEIIEETGSDVRLRVGAGRNWHSLVETCVGQGMFGFENLALIPGLVGAAPVQNIGAYGRELAEFVESVHGVDLESGVECRLSAAECEFAYRDSIFKHALRDRFIIMDVEFRLSRIAVVNTTYPALAGELDGADKPISPKRLMDAVIALRRRRLPDPVVEPNAGSFFKNPEIDAETGSVLAALHPEMPAYTLDDGRVKIPAAWLIEKSGVRSYRCGGAGISRQHALVLVNYGGASQNDILDVADQVRTAVQREFGLALEIEPRIYTDV